MALPALAPRAGDRPAARGRGQDDRLRHPVHRADRRRQQDNALIEAVGARARRRALDHRSQQATAKAGSSAANEVVRELGARAGNTVVEPDPGGDDPQDALRIRRPGQLRRRDRRSGDRDGRSTQPRSKATAAPGSTSAARPRPSARSPTRASCAARSPTRSSAARRSIIGASAPSLQDVHPTSTTGDELMSGPEIQANAIWTAEHGFPLASSGLLVDLMLILAAGRGPGGGDAAAEAAAGAAGRGSRSASLYALADPARLRRAAPCCRSSTRCSRWSSRPSARSPSTTCSPRFERQRVHDTFARFVPEAVVADVLERSRRGPPLRRRAARVHGPVQRPARLHQLLRGARAGPGDRGPQPLPGGDERRDHGPRRHPGRLHGRRDHGRLRRADRAGGPRRPRPRRGARDARGAAAALQRVAGRGRGWARASRWGSASTAAR